MYGESYEILFVDLHSILVKIETDEQPFVRSLMFMQALRRIHSAKDLKFQIDTGVRYIYMSVCGAFVSIVLF